MRTLASLKKLAGISLSIAALVGCFVEAHNVAREMSVHDKRFSVIYDMRVLANAIERYHVDHGVYPPSSIGPTSVNKNDIPSFDVRFEKFFQRLEHSSPSSGYTPEGLFRDPFVKGDCALSYFSDNETQTWALWSAGPDGKYDLDFATINKAIRDPDTLPSLSYDPSNGTVSKGDIVTTKDWYK